MFRRYLRVRIFSKLYVHILTVQTTFYALTYEWSCVRISSDFTILDGSSGCQRFRPFSDLTPRGFGPFPFRPWRFRPPDIKMSDFPYLFFIIRFILVLANNLWSKSRNTAIKQGRQLLHEPCWPLISSSFFTQSSSSIFPSFPSYGPQPCTRPVFYRSFSVSCEGCGLLP